MENDVFQATKIIKDYCAQNLTCQNCIFSGKDGCSLYNMPFYWPIFERNWREEDIELAKKILKNGFIYIERDSINNSIYLIGKPEIVKIQGDNFPLLNPGERIALRQITNENKE